MVCARLAELCVILCRIGRGEALRRRCWAGGAMDFRPPDAVLCYNGGGRYADGVYGLGSVRTGAAGDRAGGGRTPFGVHKLSSDWF